MPGMRQSSRITSAVSPDPRCSNASGPLAKVVTAKPSSIRFRLSDSRNSSSSSIRRTRTRAGICLVLGEDVGEASASGGLGGLMGLHLIMQRAHDLTFEVEVKVYLKLAAPARIAPNRCRRRLGALLGLAEQPLGRGLVKPDQALGLGRGFLSGFELRRLGRRHARGGARRDLSGRRGVRRRGYRRLARWL